MLGGSHNLRCTDAISARAPPADQKKKVDQDACKKEKKKCLSLTKGVSDGYDSTVTRSLDGGIYRCKHGVCGPGAKSNKNVPLSIKKSNND